MSHLNSKTGAREHHVCLRPRTIACHSAVALGIALPPVLTGESGTQNAVILSSPHTKIKLGTRLDWLQTKASVSFIFGLVLGVLTGGKPPG